MDQQPKEFERLKKNVHGLTGELEKISCKYSGKIDEIILRLDSATEADFSSLKAQIDRLQSINNDGNRDQEIAKLRAEFDQNNARHDEQLR